MDYRKEYERWCVQATADADVAAELQTMDDAKVRHRRGHQPDEHLHGG